MIDQRPRNMDRHRVTNSEPIAIVGSSCRFPGGINCPSKLWELLKEPEDLLTDIPPSRFNINGFYDSNAERHGVGLVLNIFILYLHRRLYLTGSKQSRRVQTCINPIC